MSISDFFMHFRFLQESISQLRNDAEMMTKPSAVTFPSSDKSTEEDLEENEKLLIKTEHQALQETVSELFVNLCGSENEVRQCLFAPKNLELLCQFFGPSQGILFYTSACKNNCSF